MALTIHCLRHAQGVHNISYDNHNLQDPSLTSLGDQQCLNFASTFPFHDQIDLIVTSPLRRTIRTALLCFAPVVARGVKMVALPQLQEASNLPCDTGSKLSTIKEEFKEYQIDFSFLEEDWYLKQDPGLLTGPALMKRADEARRWLWSRPEKNIAVVSHGCFLHFLTDDWVNSINAQATAWENTEYRSYVFAEFPESLSLEETPESRLRRGLSSSAENADEKERLREKTLETWVAWGIVAR